ncbi:MAG: DegT/DnrJ/EryC1/StrS family aminotransferase, partial [Gaiellaceae bacterium]
MQPFVPLSDVFVDETILAEVADVLAGGWWSMGPRVGAFEAAFADLSDVPHALAVANGTAALHLALLAVGVEPGDEVVLPSLNFVAAANVVRLIGATPVFCDISSLDDLNLDPTDVEAALTERTKAIIALHYGGFACDIEAIAALAASRGISLVEDAAHAPGARLNGVALGTVGQVGCFSFFANKNMPIGEGGMVVTRDDEIAETLRLLRSHGMTSLTWDRHRGHAHTYDVLRPGFNYRLDEVRAAVGLVQLRRLLEENERRGAVLDRYRSALDREGGLRFPFRNRPDGERPSYHLAVALLPEGVEQATFRDGLRDRGIQTSFHYPPIHRFSAYAQLGSARALPVTDEVVARLVTLPLFGTMSDAQFEAV